VLLAVCVLCVASALEEGSEYESEMRGIKAFKRKFRNSKPKKDKPTDQELFTAPPSEGLPSTSQCEKLDQKYNDILKAGKPLNYFLRKFSSTFSAVASLASNQREILDKGKSKFQHKLLQFIWCSYFSDRDWKSRRRYPNRYRYAKSTKQLK
jgi:hypothetical protein